MGGQQWERFWDRSSKSIHRGQVAHERHTQLSCISFAPRESFDSEFGIRARRAVYELRIGTLERIHVHADPLSGTENHHAGLSPVAGALQQQ